MRSRDALAGALCACALLLAACGGGRSGAAARPDPHRWLSVDARSRSATITLIAERDASYGGFNLDGAAKGALLFGVPSGWRVVVRCVNNSSIRRYACALQRAPGAHAGGSPPVGSAPVGSARVGSAPARAHRATAELTPGARGSFSFVAGAPARYRLAAIAGAVEPSGMWLALEVKPSGTPTVRWVR